MRPGNELMTWITENRGGPAACRDGIRRLRADDGIRTRDPHLGKVMRYQLRYVRVPAHGPVHSRQGERAFRTVADPGSRANSAPALRHAAIDPVTRLSRSFLSGRYGGQAVEPGSSRRVFPHACSARVFGSLEWAGGTGRHRPPWNPAASSGPGAAGSAGPAFARELVLRQGARYEIQGYRGLRRRHVRSGV
jgi:hypothetical protein